MKDAVRIDVESDFDLRSATRGRRNAVEVERAKVLVIARERTLTLQHLDLHARLVVAVGREDLRLASRNCRITGNHRRSHATRGFDGEGKRSYVEEEHVFNVSFKHAALD